MIAGAFDAMDAAVFVLDGARFVQAQSNAATILLREDRRLTLQTGRLAALLPDDDRKIQAAVHRALGGADKGIPGNSRFVLRGESGPLDTFIVEVFALPRQDWALGFEPRVLVTVKRPATPKTEDRDVLAASLGLTRAEAEVALLTARGLSRDQVAALRGTSLDTVSTQLKSLFRKSDVNREAELVARLNQLLF
jgi:DNA-binding CsgD family transcriptional regulator